MTEPTTATPRYLRGGARVLALSAAAVLLASCGSDTGGSDTGGADTAGSESTTTDSATMTEAAQNSFATAELTDPAGDSRGTVRFEEGDGGTVISVEATGLTPGFHGLHIHSTGVCEPDSASPTDPEKRGDFLSAGGHLAGPDGGAGHPEHAGDLPTLYVTDDGTGRITTVTDRIDRELLLDEDGSAVMVHEKSDNLANIPERYAPEGADEETRNAGDGGSRVACGVVSE